MSASLDNYKSLRCLILPPWYHCICAVQLQIVQTTSFQFLHETSRTFLSSLTGLFRHAESITSVSHRPRHSIAASLDDDLWPPADPGHPSEQAVRVDQLVAIRHLEGLTHSRPQPAIRFKLYVGERHLEQKNSQKLITQHSQTHILT